MISGAVRHTHRGIKHHHSKKKVARGVIPTATAGDHAEEEKSANSGQRASNVGFTEAKTVAREVYGERVVVPVAFVLNVKAMLSVWRFSVGDLS
jgi:hypothetical protein